MLGKLVTSPLMLLKALSDRSLGGVNMYAVSIFLKVKGMLIVMD
jgi:hypothetical protein